jgi:methionyl-tRNA formyltransferase
LRDSAGRDRKLKIFRATVVDAAHKAPGEIVVAAKDGALSLSEVQLEGKRRMSAAEFLRGHPVPLRLA